MTNHISIRKVFEGPATRQQMFSLFDRHAKRPTRGQDEPAALYAGEWFEISEAEHDYMFEILPPLWIRGSMFAMREFMTGSVTSVFFALRIDGAICAMVFPLLIGMSDDLASIGIRQRPVILADGRYHFVNAAFLDRLFSGNLCLTRFPILH